MSKFSIENLFHNFTFKKAIWFSPLIFVIHIIEEGVFGFSNYIYRHFGVDLSLINFLITYLFIIIVYIILLILFTLQPNRTNAYFILTLLAAAQFSNAFFHFFLTIIFSDYFPGVITGLVFNVPYVFFLLWIAYKEKYITQTSGAIIIALGAILMLLFEIEGARLIILFSIPISAVITNFVYLFNTKKIS
ncbi:MAG: HXXEE domain-containing protein [Promethearchaeota archaeon]